jgi:MoaA/NifB/PqqE/SkfB family radical SAM enzyme
MKIHRWLDFKVTKRCNNAHHKCRYCAVPVDPPGASELLSLPLIHRTLLDARRLAFDTFWFLGGEPSLRADADRLFLPLASDGDVFLTVVTNGRATNMDMVEALFDTQARRACVQVSLDSLRPGNFKHQEPAGMLRLVSDIAAAARRASESDHHCQVEVHTVISRENHQDFDQLVRFFASQGVPVSLAMVCPWREHSEPTHFNEFTRDELLDISARIDDLHTGLGIDAFNPLVAGFIRRVLDGAPNSRTCGAGLTHLVVNPDGAVHRCMADSFVSRTALGNLNHMRLHAILESVTEPASCPERAECFDGFAWDQLALT